jgi:hypothetical protein
MTWIDYINFAATTIVALAAGIGGYFLYRKKHPIEVKQAQVQIDRLEIENKDFIAQRLTSHIDRLDQLIEKERVDCDNKIDALRKEMQLMQDTLARNSRDIEVAMRMCNNDCFRKSA